MIHIELGFSRSCSSPVIQSSTSKSRWMMKLSLSEPVGKINTYGLFWNVLGFFFLHSVVLFNSPEVSVAQCYS